MFPAGTTRKLLWSIVCLAVPMPPALGAPLPNGLYGWTLNSNAYDKIDFVKIWPDGHATLEFDMVIPNDYEARDLTYDPTNGNFYGSLHPTEGGPFRIAQINPGTRTMTHSVYFGLQSDGVEGIEYFKCAGLVASGADVTGAINALYVVSHSGVVLETALLPDIEDQDHLGADSLGGDLHVLDTNHPTNGFKINKWVAPFSANPALVGIYNGPVMGNEVDLAFYEKKFYSSGLSKLLRYDTVLQQQQVVGDYNYSREIWGIAAAVEAPVASQSCRARGVTP